MKAILYTARCVYIGDLEQPDLDLLRQGLPAELRNAWELVIVRARSVNQNGEQGMQQSLLILPVAPADGPVACLHTTAESWVLPDEVGLGPQVERLLRDATATTLINRAQASGIQFPPRRG